MFTYLFPDNGLALIFFSFIFALVNFFGIVTFYKLFGKTGLFVWVGFGTVLANIQVVKLIDVNLGFIGFTATLGNIMYGTLFLATDALNEIYGYKDAKKAVWLGFFTLISMVIIMQMALLFKPSTEDFAQGALETIFGLMPRIALGSLTAYIISQFLDVYVYQKIKNRTGENWLILRNNGSTMISQFVDTLIFVTIAFIFVYDWNIWFNILWTTYILKFFVAALDTPFIYIMKWIKPVE